MSCLNIRCISSYVGTETAGLLRPQYPATSYQRDFSVLAWELTAATCSCCQLVSSISCAATGLDCRFGAPGERRCLSCERRHFRSLAWQLYISQHNTSTSEMLFLHILSIVFSFYIQYQSFGNRQSFADYFDHRSMILVILLSRDVLVPASILLQFAALLCHVW